MRGWVETHGRASLRDYMKQTFIRKQEKRHKKSHAHAFLIAPA